MLDFETVTKPEIRFPALEVWRDWHRETQDEFATSNVTAEIPSYDSLLSNTRP